MIRRLSYCLLAVLGLLVSCTKVPEGLTGQGVEITVRCGDPVRSKADTEESRGGEERYNENLITTVDLFFYPGEDPDRNAPAVFHVSRTSGQRGSDVFLLDLNDADVARIFPTSPTDTRKATVFAVANYPGRLVEDEADLSGTSLSTLEALEVETDFVQTPPSYKQASFLMSGTVVIDLRGRNSNIVATGTVDLIRYASKMTISVKVAPSVTLGEAVWEPMLENMAIYLVSGNKAVTLGGETAEPHYFDYVSNPRKFAYIDAQDGDRIKPVVSKSGEYYNAYPMYMYPQHWTYGETEPSTGNVEPYLKLELPWHRTTEGGYSSTQKQCYYKIFIPDDKRGGEYLRHFVRNSWYHLDIDVGLLGADTDDAAVELPGSFFMVPWQNVDQEIEKKADIGNARYLSMDKNHYDLHNTNDTEIRYTTSHPVTIKDVRVTCPYYGTKTSGKARGGVITKVTTDDDIYPKGSYYLLYNEADRKALNDGVDWLTDVGTAIHFHHQLENLYTEVNFDYSPFTVSFTIAHSDRPDDVRYQKGITLVQYPAIYITGHKNGDTSFIDTGLTHGRDHVYYSDHWGYVFVDGRQIVRANAEKDAQGKWVEVPAHNEKINQTYRDYFNAQYDDVSSFSDDDFHWRVVWYTGGTLDLFKIDVTVLPEGDEFVIGDPRTDEPDPAFLDESKVKFRVADVVGGGEQRSLRWYHPTEKSSRTINMLAPSFRFSSKCGGTEFGDLTEEEARWRCAAYQEDGFPAGRWRLPTEGEIRFVAQLSVNDAFSFLFNVGGKYWSANGAVLVGSNGIVEDPATKALTRCVYDSWYWGDTQQTLDHFYWGDTEEK